MESQYIFLISSLTVSAFTVKICGMARNFAVKAFGGFFVYIFKLRKPQIDYRVAFLTYKMIVWGRVAVKMVKTVYSRQLGGFAQIHQEREITVDGTEAYARINKP